MTSQCLSARVWVLRIPLTTRTLEMVQSCRQGPSSASGCGSACGETGPGSGPGCRRVKGLRTELLPHAPESRHSVTLAAAPARLLLLDPAPASEVPLCRGCSQVRRAEWVLPLQSEGPSFPRERTKPLRETILQIPRALPSVCRGPCPPGPWLCGRVWTREPWGDAGRAWGQSRREVGRDETRLHTVL